MDDGPKFGIGDKVIIQSPSGQYKNEGVVEDYECTQLNSYQYWVKINDKVNNYPSSWLEKKEG